MDGPTIVRHVSLDAAGDVIPWGSKKDAPSIRDDTRGQPKRPWHRKVRHADKTDVFAKRVVRGTSPVCREDEYKGSPCNAGGECNG